MNKIDINDKIKKLPLTTIITTLNLVNNKKSYFYLKKFTQIIS